MLIQMKPMEPLWRNREAHINYGNYREVWMEPIKLARSHITLKDSFITSSKTGVYHAHQTLGRACFETRLDFSFPSA